MNIPLRRHRSILALLALAATLLTGTAHAAGASAEAQAKHDFTTTIQPILKEYCVTCHSTEKQKGDLDLERFQSLQQIKRDPAVWEHALEQIRDKEMPPKDKYSRLNCCNVRDK